MSTADDLIKAIRAGRLADVLIALEAGAPVDAVDGSGNAGLPLALACLTGNLEIVRELVARGAAVNAPDNRKPSSPLAMAVRGGKPEVVKLLVEHGAEVPPGMYTGVSDHDLVLARWKAENFSTRSDSGRLAAEQLVVEEIEVLGCYGTDTNVLNADMRRLVEQKTGKK